MPQSSSVTAVREPLTLPTYPVGRPETHPMFFDKRVYQGSSGKVYPVPFIDKVRDEPEPVTYRSVRLENEYVRLVALPEIGGRILVGQDKANDDYDFFYRQDVIKPALVGLAGPWISGGVEFNWPQHHRPGTFLPADAWIEEEADGARTLWMSEHDPMFRLKGMHGLRLRPGSALIELRVRLYNRTPITRTFLWWANVAARVHDAYQSFFPPDVTYVADHAVRAMSSFPVAENVYYGIDYAARPGANDLTWYKNIPVPTSYMVCQTAHDFFGGYDHHADGGFVHVADRRIAPGKKQWTWGNAPFGWAWDRELTDEGGPYVELMAGVHTDNQPDFSYLLPGEVKSFSQFWWPYQKLGPVHEADSRLALRLEAGEGGVDAGVAAAEPVPGATIRVKDGERTLVETTADLSPGQPWRETGLRPSGDSPESLELAVFDREGRRLLAYRPSPPPDRRNRELAVEPAMPAEVESNDRLYYIGEHLEQYRHPTRHPEIYWEEGLRRDPGDMRCHLGLGAKALRRGLWADAKRHLQAAVDRLTHLHPNPETGEAHYWLGLAHRFTGDDAAAVERFAKSAWNYEWRSPAKLELAAEALRRGEAREALGLAEAAIDTNRLANRAHTLASVACRRLGHPARARGYLETILEADPLDFWALREKCLLGDAADATFFDQTRNDAQTILDIAFDYADAGAFGEAAELLERHHAEPVREVATPNPMERTPMTRYALAWMRERAGESGEAVERELAEARRQPADYAFPSRLHEQIVLEWVLDRGPDGLAAYALGNLCYDRARRDEAIRLWEHAVEHRAELAVARRNLGIAYWNVRGDGDAARAAYREALRVAPDEARLVAEYDQLCQKLGDSAEERLAFLEANETLVRQRDDACVAFAELLNRTGAPERALELLENRRFHPWEGGEGKVLRQFTRACLLLGERALGADDAQNALAWFEKAFDTPENLGEAYHPLQAKADVSYWKGRALRALGRDDEARESFEAAAQEAGDFEQMEVTEHSELSYYRALALLELGRREDAEALARDMRDYAERQQAAPAKIDYFATSLPNLLVFDEDLEAAKNRRAERLRELADAILI